MATSVPCLAKKRQQQQQQQKSEKKNQTFCFCCCRWFYSIFFFLNWLFFSKFYRTDLVCLKRICSSQLWVSLPWYVPNAQQDVTPMQTSQTKTVGVGFRRDFLSVFLLFFFIFDFLIFFVVFCFCFNNFFFCFSFSFVLP